MRLSILFETKKRSEMAPKERSKAENDRRKLYKDERRRKGRGASGSNEANKRWKQTKGQKPSEKEKKAKRDEVHNLVRTGKLKKLPKGESRHHASYGSKYGGGFKATSDDTNIRDANERKSQ